MNQTHRSSELDQSTGGTRKLLVAVVAKAKSAAGFESFLRNRDWDVIATSDIKLALSTIFSRPIHCLLITVEHPNPQCMKLQEIVAQTTNTPVILFSEGLTPGGVNILRGSNHPYILAPPLSGPAIERMVLRIEKEFVTERRTQSAKLPITKPLGNDVTVISQMKKLFEEDFAHLFETSDSDSTDSLADLSPVTKGGVNEFTHLKKDEQASALDRAAHAALKASATPNHTAEGAMGVLNQKARVACLHVDSPHFNGVLVLAFASEHEANSCDIAEFMFNFKNLLIGFLTDEGVSVSVNSVPDFCLNEVSFAEWAAAEATFLRKSIHQNFEVGVSFFSHQLSRQPLRASEDATMSRLGLQEFREDVRLAFDVYLYLPINKKYIRYAAKERFLYDSQRERLNAGGVEDVHVKRDSEKEVARYRTQIGLNDKLRSYAGKKSA